MFRNFPVWCSIYCGNDTQPGNPTKCPKMALFSITQVRGRVRGGLSVTVSTNDRVKCGGGLGIHVKQCKVVQGSAKWSEVLAKCLKEVCKRALAIGVKGRYL
jgi:hypothetical protein